MVSDDVKKKVESILKNKNFSEQDDEIVIEEKGDRVFYCYVKSDKRGSFGQLFIDGKDLTYLYGSSAINPDALFDKFNAGMRSMPHQKRYLRRNVQLPIITDEAEILSFSKKLTEAFIDLFEEHDVDTQDPLKDDWYNMIYNALVLLLSAKEEDTKLIFLTMLYHDPKLVKTYLVDVKDRDVYNYWTQDVPQFMKRNNPEKLVHYFDLRIASLIGEQEIQDLCNKYKPITA